MSSNIQLPKIVTSVSFCDSKEAPTPPGAGAGAGADTPLLDVPDSAREAIRASSSLALMQLAAPLKEILRCWSQLATMFQGHCTRADLQQSLSTPLLLFSKLWEATPRPELPQPSSSSNCRRGQSDFQLRPEISSEHLRASKSMFKFWKNGWNAHAQYRTASKHQGFGHPDAPLHPRRPQRLTNGWTLILTFIHSHTHKNMEYADIKNMEYTQSVCFYMLWINSRESHPPKSKTLVSAMTLVPRPRVSNPSSFIARSQKGYGRIQVMEGWYWLWFTLWALKTVLSGIQ